MIGDRQMWRQYDLNIHRDLILMSRGTFKVDHLKLDAAAVFAWSFAIDSASLLQYAAEEITSF